MSETQPTTQDSAGITRTATGEIAPPEQKTDTTSTETTKETQSSTDTKKEGEDKTLATKTDDKKPGDKPAGAPEKYEAFKLPEGYEMAPEMTTSVEAMFKKHGLSQEAGQELVDFYTKHVTEAADGPVKVWQDWQKQWSDEVIKSDLGNGTDGLKPEVKSNIAKVINSLGDQKTIDAFKEAMDITGAGNHPAFVRALNIFAARVVEGTQVKGTGPSTHGQQKPGSAQGPSAEAMYPHLAQRG